MSSPSVPQAPVYHKEPEQPSFQSFMPTHSQSYPVSTLANQYIPQESPTSGKAQISTGYQEQDPEQVCGPKLLSQAYPAAASGKHKRSNDDTTDFLDDAPCAKRPRTLSSSIRHAPRRSADVLLGRPVSRREGRDSWEFSAYLHSDPPSANPDSAQGQQYRPESIVKANLEQSYKYEPEPSSRTKSPSPDIKPEKR